MDYLYEVEGKVTPSCASSHITYSFFAAKKYKTMKYHFEYSPKNLDNEEQSKQLILESLRKYGYEDSGHRCEEFMPLKNHLTLSFDDPVQFRGATHRHDSNLELVLSDSNSSPGLISSDNPPGMWKVTISMHAVVTDECKYKLKIWGLEND